MAFRAGRTDDELRELAGHVLWHEQQMCFRAVHPEEHQGFFRVTRFDYPSKRPPSKHS